MLSKLEDKGLILREGAKVALAERLKEVSASPAMEEAENAE